MGVIGYVLIGLGMILVAIPTIRLIRWIKASCGGGNEGHTHKEEDSKEPTTMRNSVKYYPNSEDRLEYDSQPMPSMSKRQEMLEQEMRANTRDPTECD